MIGTVSASVRNYVDVDVIEHDTEISLEVVNQFEGR